jgi:glutamate/tyrosine decarboxylase-like PLP-dependent enzyme
MNKSFPTHKADSDRLLAELEDIKSNDLKWKEGRAFSYVYYASPIITETLAKAYNAYFSENALNPSAFPSLRKMETEVVSMCLSLFNGSGDSSGIMTSGGTESILMAVKSAKAYAYKTKGIQHPEVIMSVSAHPAFNKACEYFGIKLKILPVADSYHAVPGNYEKAITNNTILIVASAPSYPQGVVDPIPEIGQIALKSKIPMHVDACVGGFLLPFIKDRNFSDFDLGVPGVTSLSADVHKYGYASKGSSVLLYNDNELRKSQFYIYTGWPGGIYASPSIMGTRPGGAIAVAWTVLQLLGREGYEEMVAITMSTAKKYQEFLETFDGISVIGKPDTCIFSIEANSFNIYELGDEMHELGWQMDRQQDPAALHLSISPIHAKVFDEFAKDFDLAYKKARKTSVHKLKNKVQVSAAKGLKKILPEKAFGKLQKLAVQKSDTDTTRSAALYGMIGDLKGSGTLDEMIIEFLDKLTK